VSIVQAAISGALFGALYALMAGGLTLTWGMLQVINLAHFALILLGGYLTFELATNFGLNPFLTLVVTVPVLFALGAAIQFAFDRFRLSEFNSLLVSFGVLIVVIQLITNVWTADFRRLSPEVNPYATGSVAVGPLVFPTPTLLGFGAAVILAVAGHLLLERTYTGRALRAFAQDRTIASAFGIDHVRLGILLAGVAGASAAVAGMLFAVGQTLTPSHAFEWIGIVFAVVILGGIGNLLGTLIAGVFVGMAYSVVGLWNPALAPVVVFSIVVLALLFRPRGLLPTGGH
jgi:branched-chain amino acid transport system permease protein